MIFGELKAGDVFRNPHYKDPRNATEFIMKTFKDDEVLNPFFPYSNAVNSLGEPELWLVDEEVIPLAVKLEEVKD